MVIYAVKNTINMTDYAERLDSELALKKRLVLVIVNVVMVLLLVSTVSPVRELFSVVGTEFRTFLIVLVAILSFVRPVSTFILIVAFFASLYIVSEIFPFQAGVR